MTELTMLVQLTFPLCRIQLYVVLQFYIYERKPVSQINLVLSSFILTNCCSTNKEAASQHSFTSQLQLSMAELPNCYNLGDL